jgi:hypothetical protein
MENVLKIIYNSSLMYENNKVNRQKVFSVWDVEICHLGRGL